MTERDLLIGLFNLVGALAERLTGEAFVLAIEDEEGNQHQVYPSNWRVMWARKAEQGPCVDLSVSSPTLPAQPDGPDANSPGPRQVVEP